MLVYSVLDNNLPVLEKYQRLLARAERTLPHNQDGELARQYVRDGLEDQDIAYLEFVLTGLEIGLFRPEEASIELKRFLRRLIRGVCGF